jgi:hypothetical protein
MNRLADHTELQYGTRLLRLHSCQLQSCTFYGFSITAIACTCYTITNYSAQCCCSMASSRYTMVLQHSLLQLLLLLLLLA